MSAPREYLEQLPVTEEWVLEHVGESWSFDFSVDLDSLVYLDGLEGLNDLLDAITGLVLTGISYQPIEILEDTSILVRATGRVEIF